MKIARPHFLILLTLAATFLLAAPAAYADTEMMLLIDASGSLASPGAPGTGHSKFDEVRIAVSDLLQTLPADVNVGLRVIGGTPAADCYTTYLFFTPTPGVRSYIQDNLDATRPEGNRGLVQGVEDCFADIGSAYGNSDRVILVITDGGDDCGRDFSDLTYQYSYDTTVPRVVVYGLDLPMEARDDIADFVVVTGGRLIDLDSVDQLRDSIVAFANEFANNLRIHLQDSLGNAVSGDIVVWDQDTGSIVEERLDVTDYSFNIDPGTYYITARYLGQNSTSDTFTIGSTDSRTVSMTFDIHRSPFTLQLRDMFGNPLRARVTFINDMNEPILTTDVAAHHRVDLPVGTYKVEIRIGDYTQEFAGIQVGPMYDDNMELEVPVEVGTLEIEISNVYGTPLNSRIEVYDSDGTLMDEAPFSSYLYSRLPPGTYRVRAEYEGVESEQTAYLASGDQIQVGIDLDIALGDLFIMLRTESNNDAWGWVWVYNSDGHLLERFDRERVESPDWYVTDLPVGTYRIEAEVDDIVRTMTGVEVTENEETQITLTFPDATY
jgi:hypothetical protein